MTYTVLKLSDETSQIISNILKDTHSNEISLSNFVKNTAGVDTLIFSNNPIGRKIASGPVFVAPERNRTFVV